MLLKKRSGFTLVELMVVIVIIGVLASLAIPRFTEASDKAKMAEAPRVIASYQGAYLAALAEKGTVTQEDDLIFKLPAYGADSRWFHYTANYSSGHVAATAGVKIGIFSSGGKVGANFISTSDMFENCYTVPQTIAEKLIPNFAKGAKSACSG